MNAWVCWAISLTRWHNKLTTVIGWSELSDLISQFWQAERRRKLGLAPEEPSTAKPSAVVEEKKVLTCPEMVVFFMPYLFIWNFEISACRVSCQLGLPQKPSRWGSACVLSSRTTRYIYIFTWWDSVVHLPSSVLGKWLLDTSFY